MTQPGGKAQSETVEFNLDDTPLPGVSVPSFLLPFDDDDRPSHDDKEGSAQR